MRAEIARLQQDLGVTTLYVTHDQVEAMTMGDRVAVMRKGELQQVATPQELYDTPVNLFVAGFIGSPSMNMLEGTLEGHDDDLSVHLGEHHVLELDPSLVKSRPGVTGYVGRPVVVGIRPEDLEDAAVAGEAPPERTLRGTVELREALGSEIMVHLAVDAPPAVTDEVRELAADAGAQAPAGEPGRTATMVGRFSARSRVKPGDAVEAVVDTRFLHFFDPETGLGIYGTQTKGPTS
jgi:multiple sugar transport system ATP-binding protein